MVSLYLAWPAHSTAVPAQSAGVNLANDLADLNKRPLGATWTKERLTWYSSAEDVRKPDVTTWASSICLTTEVAANLLQGGGAFERLPIMIDGEEWLTLNVLEVLDGVDLATSDFWTLPPESAGVKWFNWTNVVYARSNPPDLFHLRGGAHTQTFLTQAWVDRYASLRLRGLRFEPIGHLIADASQAISKPQQATTPAPQGKRLLQPKLTARALARGELEELRASGDAMRRRLQLDTGASAEETLQSLTALLHELRPSWLERSKEEQVDALLGLSAIYGDAICKTHRWTWAEMRQGRDRRWLAVLSPAGTHALALVPYFHQQIEARTAPTTALIFNMIGAGHLPSAKAEQIVSIG
jgi:hypothetical protein